MQVDQAETANIEKLISRIGAGLDQFLKFEHEDCWHAEALWRARLDVPLPRHGVGIDHVIDDLVTHAFDRMDHVFSKRPAMALATICDSHRWRL